MSTERLPDGLQLAVNTMKALGCGESSDAIRAEHAQRVTLQHHSCDLAQRVADLEAERDEQRRLFIQACEALADLGTKLGLDDDENDPPAIFDAIEELQAERDELRARLAEIEAQEPGGRSNLARMWLAAHYGDEFDADEIEAACWKLLGCKDRSNELFRNLKMPISQAIDLALSEKQAVQHDAVVRSVVSSGENGVRVTWCGGFPQIGTKLYAGPVTAQAVPDGWRLVLAEARDLFAAYAESHRARGPEHAAKAARNEAMATKISAALAGAPEHKA